MNEPAVAAVARAHRAARTSPHSRARRRRRARRSPCPTTRRCYRWSVDQREAFLARAVGLRPASIGERGERVLVDGDRMPGARWFPDARLNFAENLLARGAADDARTRSCSGARTRSSGACRTRSCAPRCRASRRRCAARGEAGRSRRGATSPTCRRRSSRCSPPRASGAIWSSASPDFGVQGVLDRFGQIEPRRALHRRRLLVQRQAAADPRQGRATSRKRLPSLRGRRRALPAGELGAGRRSRRASRATRSLAGDFVAPFAPRPIAFERLPFDHPLYILYSSGTTGVPKCIVHGAGGTLLQHLKEHRLHCDLKPGDRLFYFTTCGWMMWNWLASGARLGRDAAALRRLAVRRARDGSSGICADEERMTHFGTSAKYIDALKKIGLGAAQGLPPLELARACSRPAARWRPRASTTSTSASRTTCACRRFPAAPTSSPASRSAARRGRCGAASCNAAALGMEVEVVRRGRQADSGGHEAGRARLHCAVSVDADRVLERPDGAQVPRRLLRALPGRLVPRRLRRADRARRHDHLRPLRRDAQSRAACASARPRSTARSSSSTRWSRASSSARTGRPGEIGDVRVVLFVRLRDGSMLDDALDRQDQAAHPREHDAATRAGEDRAGDRHSAHQERQDRRAGGAQRRARRAR